MPTGAWLYSYAALWVLILMEYLVIVLLVRQVGRLYGYWVRNDPDWGLPLGSPAPALPNRDVYGRPVSQTLVGDRKTVLFFLSSGCHSCQDAIQCVAAIANVEGVEVILVIRAAELQAKMFVSKHHREGFFPGVPVIADPDSKVFGQYKVTIVPYIMVVNQEGRIAAKGTAIKLAEIGNLIQRADRLSASVEPEHHTALVTADGLDAET